MKNIEFQLSVDLIRKSLQGLEIEIAVDDVIVKLHPPVKGILLEPSEIKRIKNVARSIDKGYQVEKVIDDILRNKFSRD